MILLFNNIIDNATLTSLNASLNYPVENLQNISLRKRYQCSIDTDTITITFAEDSPVQDFWYAFTNADYLELRLYDQYAALLETITVNDPQDIGAFHLAASVDAAYAELDITGYGGVYLGGIGLGVGIEFPDPDQAWEEPREDNSSVSHSRAGQSSQDYVRPLRVHDWEFLDITRNDINYYQDFYDDLGIGRPIWIDPFDRNHSFMQPIYAVMTQAFRALKDGRNYRFNLNIREAR